MPGARDRARLLGHPERVAPRLLGATVTSKLGSSSVSVRITEVEAYAGVGEDPGSHAFRRMTARNATMFGPAGHAYVYFTYGMHWCLNVVVAGSGTAGAILLRAGQVCEGQDTAWARRPSARRSVDLARGPARLSAVLGVTGEQDGIDMLDHDGPLTLSILSSPPKWSDRTPRTGVAGEGSAIAWRFILDDPTVSPYRPARARARG